MQVKSFVECSKGSILQYFCPSLSYHLSLGSLFCLFYTGFTVITKYILGDQQSKECPEGFMFYAGTCFLFKRTSANGSSARDYCESAGGQLAVFTKDVEHWFAYTMVLKLLTGKYENEGRLNRGEYKEKIWSQEGRKGRE